MAEQYQIGKVISALRKQQGITQEELGFGLYQKASMSKIETGLFLPSKSHLDALMERLGTSMEYYGTFYDSEEYKFYQKKREIQELLWKENYSEVRKQKEKLEMEWKESANKLQQQFFQYMELYLRFVEGENPELLEKELLKVLHITLPGFPDSFTERMRYNKEELSMLAFYGELFWKSGRKKESIRLLQYLLYYVETKIPDPKEKVKLYPGLALLLAEKRWEEGRDIHSFYERVLIVLRGEHRIYYLREWLLLKKKWIGNDKLLSKIEEQVLLLFSRLSPEKKAFFDSIPLFSATENKGTLISYQFLSMRNYYGYTQAEFSELSASTTAVTISRIENGHTVPRSRTYQELMGKEKELYQPFLKTNDPKLFQMKRKLAWALEKRDYVETELVLKQLEEKLDQEEALNKQVLLYYKVVLDKRRKRRGIQELLNDLDQALSFTLPKNCSIETWPLSQMENTIWNQIAILKAEEGNRREAIQILEKLLRSYENNPVAKEDNMTAYLLSLDNLVNYLGDERRHEEAIHYAEEEALYAFSSGRGHMLTNALYRRIWNMEQLHYEKKACLTELKQAFSLAALIDYQTMKKHIEKHCLDLYQISLEEWLKEETILD